MSELKLEPKNPIASFVDTYGDERVIHRPVGRKLAVFNGGDTPILRMNRAVAVLFGQRVHQRRGALKLSQRELCQRAGFVDVNPKQRIHAIETATRLKGVRFGTLYALAHALECEPFDLMPTLQEALDLAGVSPQSIASLNVA